MAPTDRFDIVDFVIAFEAGELAAQDAVEGLVRLKNDGILDQLQGFYGRTFHDLARQGIVKQDAAGTWIIDADALTAATEE